MPAQSCIAVAVAVSDAATDGASDAATQTIQIGTQTGTKIGTKSGTRTVAHGSVRRILVRAPSWVGDFVMATPSFARLRQAFPDATITCALRPYLRPLLSGTAWFDALLDAPRTRRLGDLLQQVAAVRRASPDLAVVLPNSLAAGLVPFLARVPERLGYRQGRPGLMTLGLRARPARAFWQWWRHGPRRVPEPMPVYYERLLDLLHIPRGGHRGVLAVTDAEREAVDRWLSERGIAPDAPLVLLNPGASYGASKLWLPERFAAVARHAREAWRMVPLVTAGPAEVELANAIAHDAGARALTDPVLPLDLLKGLVQRARLMITTDTGPRHIAVAFGVPVVCVMGSTDRRYTDYCLDETIVVREDLECAPCQAKVCPLGHHDCMRRVSVERVTAAAEELLRRTPKPA